MTFASSDSRTIEQPTDKIAVLENAIVLAGTGAVGMNQRFSAILKQAYQGTLPLTYHPSHPSAKQSATPVKLYTKDSPLEIAKALSRAAIEDMVHTYIQPGGYGALVAFPCRNEPHMCEFPLKDFQPELKDKNIWYASMGSAQGITDPFLGFIRRAFWEEGPPSVKDAIFAVTWTLQHAIDLNTGGVNGPIQIAILEKGKDSKYSARRLDPAELDEYQQHILDAYKVLRKYKDFRTLPESQPDERELAIPDVPKLGDQ